MAAFLKKIIILPLLLWGKHGSISEAYSGSKYASVLNKTLLIDLDYHNTWVATKYTRA